MEKNKNRTDLLAAGRKKLQQFRQKKDNKTSSSTQGKSSRKTIRSDGEPESVDSPIPPANATDADMVSSDSVVSSSAATNSTYEETASGDKDDLPSSNSSNLNPVANAAKEGAVLLKSSNDASTVDVMVTPSDFIFITKAAEGEGDTFLSPVGSEEVSSKVGNWDDGTDFPTLQGHVHDLELPVLPIDEDKKFDKTVDQEADCLGSDRCEETSNGSPGSLLYDGEETHEPQDATAIKHDERSGANSLIVENLENPSPTQGFVPGQLEGVQEGLADIDKPEQVLRSLEEEEPRVLLKFGESVGSTVIGGNRVPLEGGIRDSLEAIEQHLYLTNIAKDFLHLQLAEQIETPLDCVQLDQHVDNIVSELQTSVKESQESSSTISEDLEQLRFELKAMAAGKEESETQFLAAKAEIGELGARACELQNRLEKSEEEVTQLLAGKDDLHSKLLSAEGEVEQLTTRAGGLQNLLEKSEEEAARLSVELAFCKGSLKNLGIENAQLTQSILLVTEESRKLEEEKMKLVRENAKVVEELFEHRQLFFTVHAKEVQLAAHLAESMVWIEQLTEENIFLSNSFYIYKVKVKEYDDRYKELLSLCGNTANQIENSDRSSAVGDKPFEDNLLNGEKHGGENASSKAAEPVEHGSTQELSHLQVISDDSAVFSLVKGHLEEAERITQKLEKVIQGMHSHSASLTRSVGKGGASGVSKLIQAFESKVHQDETGLEEGSSTEGVQSADSFNFAKEQTSNLRDILKLLDLDLGKAHDIFEEEKENGKHATLTLRELEVEIGFQKQQQNQLLSKNDELVEMLTEFQTRLDVLLNQIYEMQLNSDEVTGKILNQVEYLQKEVGEKTSSLEQERNNLLATISKAVEKIEKSIRLLASPGLPTSDNSDIRIRFASSVDAAAKAIESLQMKLEAAYVEHEIICNSFKEHDKKLSDSNGRNEAAVGLLNKIYGDLRKLVSDSNGDVVETEMDLKSMELLAFVDTKSEMFIQQLQILLDERQNLQSLKNEIMSELTKKDQDIEAMKVTCLDLATKLEENEMKNDHSDAVIRLLEYIEDIIQLEGNAIEADEPPLTRLEAMIMVLHKKYKEFNEQVTLSKSCIKKFSTRPELSAEYWEGSLHTLLREEYGYKVAELKELEEKVYLLSTSNLQKEDEIHILKVQLCKMEGDLKVALSELSTKASELEQSEQKLSSVREKLSIAVSKGKGLVLQRDALKQSLVEKSNEFEICLQELQSKDATFYEVERKLKAYSESGERVEALESELSYIRNSATALRESFLLKDSVIQRIEEVLEDIEFPEHFHSKDVIDKIEWLARSSTCNSMPLADWDRKASLGESYPEEGYEVMNAWKENPPQSLNHAGLNDLRRKYDELESKFYGLAEHNEMLEQSLMERNNLVQMWEEVLGQIDVPLHLRSMEPEDRIDWLGRALVETRHERDSYQHKIENLESQSKSLTDELEESQRKLSYLEATLVTVTHEKEELSESLENLREEHEKLSEEAAQFDIDKDCLHKEVADLNVKLVEIHERFSQIENAMMRFQVLVCDALPDCEVADPVTNENVIDCFEISLRKLLNYYTSTKLMPEHIEKGHVIEEVDVPEEQRLQSSQDAMEQEILSLKDEFATTLQDLSLAKEERDAALEKYESQVLEVEVISKQRNELQELLNLEEQKSASLREKLNVAVRKGKALVQQRDNLKQSIEEMSTETGKLKHELNQKIKDTSAFLDKLQSLESDNLLLKGLLEESKQEAKKSKIAAELLVVELNEVHERAEEFQEEVAKTKTEFAELSEQRNVAESLRVEAVSNFEEFKKNQHAKLVGLAPIVDELKMHCLGFEKLLANLLSKDVEILSNVEAGLKSFMKQVDAKISVDVPLLHLSPTNPVDEAMFPATGISSRPKMKDESSINELFGVVSSGVQECTRGLDGLKKKCDEHSIILDQQAAQLPKIMETIRREIYLQRESSESLKGDIIRLEMLKKEKDAEINQVHRSIASLYEACTGSILEIENRTDYRTGMAFKVSPHVDKESANAPIFSLTEDFIKRVADTLLSAVKNILSEVEENNQSELKASLTYLQKEIQEKDIQSNRICTELVAQIKEAEVTAKNYLVDLESAKAQAQGLERQVEVLRNEQNLLEARVSELKNWESASRELQERVESLTKIVAAKDQEIEALMQALDEEESQMEGLGSRIEELEKIVQQKNLALESLEASRGKTMAKLSTTVSKFNELHQLSESLLVEIENLQTQLQGRDAEISFLRQEVTRCTKDVLTSQESIKMNSSEALEVMAWLEMMASHFEGHDVHFNDQKGSRIHAYMEFLERNFTSVFSELENLRVTAQSRDILLQTERSRVEELVHKEEILRSSLREKESQLELFQGERESGQLANINTLEIMEVEPKINKRTMTSGSIAPHVRSVRKLNSDQVAVGIDLESGDNTLDDEDDDKAHGFRSLTMSRIVPRFSRPIADRIDGLWVSGERLLMRQPTLRLGVVIYYILMHVLIATSIV